ncbi:protein GLUTAMINE DUMPER 5 [Abrus precatorius]|uniref:Protein GLUTAMINE DUMPER 5 n=1 Tax=Abrus precatorius TaxID=3816 RepID=A0A8B8LFA3_ABRPR|nr:protein GLUTAMINE DUMPER 5 [Abrus precatorius]
MRSISTTSSIAPTTTSSLASAQHSSSWHSPVPYLFGGLAAMLGLIAFALLILACSYWKLSGQLQNEENGQRELESVNTGDSSKKESVKVYEEKILVIMAGDEKPTFLATPACSNSSSFAHGVANHFDQNLENHVVCQKSEKETENHLQPPQEETPQQNQLQ